MSMSIELVIADITTMQVDAIVNAANNSLMGGGGVDGAIHRAAGIELKEYCFNLRGCNTGHAKITPGFRLPAKYIIHTVGPVWNNGTNNEMELLENCYRNSLELATENGLESIAFPCISTGAYRFPFDAAAQIAIHTISMFLKTKTSLRKVCLVVHNQNDFEKYNRVFKKLVSNTK